MRAEKYFKARRNIKESKEKEKKRIKREKNVDVENNDERISATIDS